MCKPTPPPPECKQQGKNCGTLTNACTGAPMNCGKCADGENLTDNVCKSCIPKTCAEQGLMCGSGTDWCGGTLSCGMCPSVLTCYNNKCCSPTTCDAQGKNCGTISNGCGGQLMCGACTVDGETCGGAGTANVCGVCKPKTCGPTNCGNDAPTAAGSSSTALVAPPRARRAEAQGPPTSAACARRRRVLPIAAA